MIRMIIRGSLALNIATRVVLGFRLFEIQKLGIRNRSAQTWLSER